MSETKNAIRRRCQVSFPEQGRTHGEFKDQCDVNRILTRWKSTGQLTHVRNVLPTFGDFSNVTDYRDAVESVRAAEAAFAALPSRVRAMARNNPGVLLDMLQDPAAMAALEAAGLPKQPATGAGSGSEPQGKEPQDQ